MEEKERRLRVKILNEEIKEMQERLELLEQGLETYTHCGCTLYQDTLETLLLREEIKKMALQRHKLMNHIHV